MSQSMEEALLKQRLEFLESELEEYKKRETSLKELNDSLMSAVNSSTSQPLQDQATSELQKAYEQSLSDLQTAKKKFKQQLSSLEKQNRELSVSNKELLIEQKQQKINEETERHRHLSKIQQLENERLSLEKALKSLEDEKELEKEAYKYQAQLKLQEIQREMDLLKEKHKQELMLARQEADSTLVELKTMFQKESESLRQQNKALQNKIRQFTSKQERESDDLLKKIEELEEELAIHKTAKSNDELHKVIARQDRQIKEMINDMSDRKRTSPKTYRSDESESLRIQKEKAEIELEKTKVTLQQFQLESAVAAERWAEKEKQFTNEIKFLIGKLLKAKSKLGVEGELLETIRKETMLTTLKNRTLNKTKASPAPMSPLDLSHILKSESPFVSRDLEPSLHYQ